MRRLLGILLLGAVLLAGCSDDGSDEDVQDPAPTSQSDGDGETPTDDPTASEEPPDPGWRLVDIVHATAVDGQVSSRPTPIPDAQAVADFSAQFTRPELEEKLQRVVSEHQPEDGAELVAAVVSVGCDVPTGVTYADGKVKALKVAEPMPECFAAVTSVAILEVAA
jgi:hypothetical protein